MQCVAKPEGDAFKFTHFAHKLMAGKGLNPLPSDSRRRKDRLALQLCDYSTAGTHKTLLEEAQRSERRVSVLGFRACAQGLGRAGRRAPVVGLGLSRHAVR